MSSPSSSFTRGSQVFMHNIQMLKQAIKFGVVISFFLAFSFFGLKTYKDVGLERMGYAADYAWVKLDDLFGVDKTKSTYQLTYPNGTSKVVTHHFIYHDPFMRSNYYNTLQVLRWNGILSLGVMGGSALLVMVLWRRKGRKMMAKRIQKGQTLTTPNVLNRLIKKQKKTSLLKLGDVTFPEGTETQHLLLCGTTGTGKSTLFFDLLHQIRILNQPAVILDTTGEFVSRFYRPGIDILLNPFDERSASWHPWCECHEDYHYDDLAKAFIPDTHSDPFWSSSARTVFVAALKKLKTQKSLSVLINYCTQLPLKEIQDLFKGTEAAALIDLSADKTAASIRANLANSIQALKFIISSSDPQDKVFSVRDWIQKIGSIKTEATEEPAPHLFIACTPTQREAMKSLMSGWFSVAASSLMEMGGCQARRVWFMIDELPSLHKVPFLQTLLAEGRKYGACVVAGFQDIHQIKSLYGHHDAEALLSLFNTKVLFKAGNVDTAQWMSKSLGDQDIIEKSEGISFGANTIRDGVSLNEMKRTEMLVSPTDCLHLPPLTAYVKLALSYPITKITLKLSPFMAIQAGFEKKKEPKKEDQDREKVS